MLPLRTLLVLKSFRLESDKGLLCGGAAVTPSHPCWMRHDVDRCRASALTYPIAAPAPSHLPEQRPRARSVHRRAATRRPRSCRTYSRGRNVPTGCRHQAERNQNPGITRLERRDAANNLMHPIRHRAESVVIEARHLGARSDEAFQLRFVARGLVGVPCI
jgi:hypothetical protein